MSGHSKWTQIKHKKAATDAKKGKLFSRLAREITVAARDGGPAPENSSRLKSAMERARSLGLPKDNIKRAIERASGGRGGEDLQEFLYEATLPGGISLLIEGITDNKNRTLAEIKHLLNEHGGKLADPGSVIWGFEKVGWLEIYKQENVSLTEEDVEMIMIEAGVKDFQKTNVGWTAETALSDTDKIRQGLEKSGVKIKDAGHDYKPANLVEVNPEELEQRLRTLDEITEHEDIQEVYTNISRENL